MPLVADLSHNLTRREGRDFVTRKGACRAALHQPVIIPGSMGARSYLNMGLGQPDLLCSASHGAGRARSRSAMHHASRKGEDLGLHGVECITLKDERRLEEAPVAYKDISAVVDVQERLGTVRKVAAFRPLFTFKS